jgi:beta-1,4-N-acetylglucosaminyltransferase
MLPLLLLLLLLTIALLLSARILYIWLTIQRHRKLQSPGDTWPKRTTPIRTLIILGSGGHTTEMLFMTKHLHKALYNPIYYCKASTDTTSRDRLRTVLGTNNHDFPEEDAKNRRLYDIPRAREVGQSYTSSVFTTLYACFFAFRLVFQLRPELILCNGPGTSIPIILAGLVLRVLGVKSCKIVFIESYCRVQTLSMTGKILYPIADLFMVHWKELHKKYPNSILTSTFIASER